MNRFRTRLLAFTGVTTLSLVGLVGLGATQAFAEPVAAQGAWVRAAHLVPGLGTMAIGLTPFDGDTADAPSGDESVPPAKTEDGVRTIAPKADYGAVTDYQQIPSGYYTISVRPAGAAADSAPLITGTLNATPGAAFTVAGLGTKSDPKVEALSDDLTPPEAGAVRVRLLPAASSAKTVTVTAAGGPTVAQEAGFGRPTGYAAVPSGAWRLTATADGAEDTAATTRVDLAGGSVYTLLVLDSGKGLKVKPVLDASGMDVMPAGGAQTGGGGLLRSAWSEHGLTAGISLLVAGLALLLVRVLAGQPARDKGERR